jgi:hypothetical protein
MEQVAFVMILNLVSFVAVRMIVEVVEHFLLAVLSILLLV